MKKKLGIAGAVISFCAIIAFAIELTIKDIPQNTVTWILWTLLDGILLVASLKAGNKRPWLPAGFTASAFLVTAVLLWKGVWQWGMVETVSVVGVGLSLLLWKKLGPKWAIIMGVAAMNIAGWPAIYDAYINPNPLSWWMWFSVGIAAILTSIAAEKWSIEDRLFPVEAIFFNMIMFSLVIQ